MLGVEMVLREEGGEEGQKAEAKEWRREMLEVYVPPPLLIIWSFSSEGERGRRGCLSLCLSGRI